MLFIPNFRKRLVDKFNKIFIERFEYIYKDLPDQVVRQNNRLQIPNVVYQTWVTRSLPWRMFNEIRKFRNLNNNFSFILYNDEERDKYMKEYWGKRKIYEIYKKCVFPAMKADIWRYCILYEKGGYYFDIKSSCKSPLSKLKTSRGTLLTKEINYNVILPPNDVLNGQWKFNLNIITNWVLGFKKEHPLLEILITNIENHSKFYEGKIFNYPKPYMIAFTGPGMLTKSYWDYLRKYKKEIKMCGIDLNGKGIFQVRGSQYRFKESGSYSSVRNSKILN